MSTRHRFLFLDALRGLAAIAVLFYHRRDFIPFGIFEHGYLAVDFFFMLSGFVIAYAYEEKLLNGMSPRQFIIKRLIRLMPLVFLGASLGLGVEVLKALSKHDFHRLEFAFYAFPFSALTLPNPPQISSEAFLINPVIWSLFFEIFANIVYALYINKLSTRVLTLISLVCIGFLIHASYHFDGFGVGQNFESLKYGVFRVGFPFSIGIILYRCKDLCSNRREGKGMFLIASLLAAILAFPVLINNKNYIYDAAMVGIAFPILLYGGSLVNLKRTINKNFIEMAGLISYPLYVIHIPILDALDYPLAWLSANNLTRMIVYLISALFLAYAASEFYDRPLQAHFKRVRQKIINKTG